MMEVKICKATGLPWKRQPQPYGPFARQRADGQWEMNEEGQAFLMEWLVDWPQPARLLNKAYRSTFDAYIKFIAKKSGKRHGYETVNQTCRIAICNAIMKYQPDVCRFTTYAAFAMRIEAQKEMSLASKAERAGAKVNSGHTIIGDTELFQLIPDTKTLDVEVRVSDHKKLMAESMIDAIPSERNRDIVRKRYLFDVSQVALADEYQVSKSRIQQILDSEIRRIRKIAAKCAEA